MKKYNKKINYSYSLGVYPTLELVKYRADKVKEVFLDSSGMNNSGIKQIVEICNEKRVRCKVNDQIVSELSIKENCLTVGIFNKYTGILKKNEDHLVLVEPRDMGNLGSIFRSALAFGIKSIAIIRPAADIFDPKVVRASMGAIFPLDICYFDNIDQYILQNQNRILYAFYVKSTTLLNELSEIKRPASFIFGNEANGLGEKLRSNSIAVTIPQSEDVDSLNLAVSVGIGLYEYFVRSKNFL